MAINFTKNSAFAVLESFEVGANTAKLGDIQLTNIMKIVNTLSFRSAYSTRVSFSNGSDLATAQGSLTVLFSGGLSNPYKTKTVLGLTDASHIGKQVIKEKTFMADSVQENSVIIGKVDIDELSGDLAADATQNLINLMSEVIEQGFFQGLGFAHKVGDILGKSFGGVVIPTTFPLGFNSAETASKSEIISFGERLTAQALLLAKLSKDAKDVFGGNGIQRISRDEIFIDMADNIFAKFVSVYALATVNLPTIEGGTFTTANFMGFTIRSNPNMEYVRLNSGSDTALPATGPACGVLISTGYAAVIPWRHLEMTAKQPFQNSDTSIYNAYKVDLTGGKEVFQTTIYGYYGDSPDQTTYDAELQDGLVNLATAANAIIVDAGKAISPVLLTAIKALTPATVADWTKAKVTYTNPAASATVTTATLATAKIYVPVVEGKVARPSEELDITFYYKNS